MHINTVTRIIGGLVAAGLALVLTAGAPADRELTAKGQRWVKDAGRAFAAVIRHESPKIWWDCGEKTPLDQWDARGEKIAEATLIAMKRNGLRVDPMGLLAVAWNESRGNPCSIGPRTRARAEKMKLLPEGKAWFEYTREDVLAVLDNEKWQARNNVADVGLYQDVFPNYARIIDDGGDKRCLRPKNVACRVPRTAELVNIETSAEVGVHGMLVRYYHFRTREPWFYWPWTVKEKYSKQIAFTMKALEAKMPRRTR
jgi:hypothetical protein